ncbi:FAD binding domain-containing protein [Treponema brennaborense]|uniref:Molybdopterin dehydrogenase FAD-binding protein n=1 Tax=Treponema brennaborense (strain DSM 12168 / CIP 105900 / DD5/3) TaxID=906968 RepID=F4LQG5_TREBD|nr:FAD binding domain-containing protein [Treponema brennaborense]AEE17174.1 molybdopterin dehydrogenase FAD-binding protein [Treponema brennaborense DSM 12168]
MAKTKTVYFARNMADVLYQLKTVSDLHIFGGCTYSRTLADTSLIIRNVPELKEIDRRERYIDFGAAVTLSQLLDLGKKRLPAVLFDSLHAAATPLVRNLATVGGNICIPGIKHSLFAPLLAVDARLECRNSSDTEIIPITQFTAVPSGWLLSKIRVPIDEWDIAVFRRIGSSYNITESSASFTFLANTQKGILFDLRIAFCGKLQLRSRELENRLIGSRLPLTERKIEDMLEAAAQCFDDICERESFPVDSCRILKKRFLSMLGYSMEQLT